MSGLVLVAALVRWVDLWTIPIFTDEGDEIGLALLSGLLLVPLVNGKFAPLVSNTRYLAPMTVLLLASIAAWCACTLGDVRGLLTGPLTGRPDDARRQLAQAVPLALALLLAAFTALEAAYRPGDVVILDQAMYRDWTLTEGRLQRVFDSWLELRGIPHRVVDVEEDGRPRRDLATRGGLAVLARRATPIVAREYSLDEIVSDADPDAPAGTGYSIVRLSRTGG